MLGREVADGDAQAGSRRGAVEGHAVERAVVLAEGSTLDFSQLPAATVAVAAADSTVHTADNDYFLDFVEEKTIRQALQYYQGNVSQAAKALGLTRGALYRRLEKYGL